MPRWWTRVLVIGDMGPDVLAIQRILGLPHTSEYDLMVAMTVRAVQVEAGLPANGIVDADTAKAIGPRATDELAPEWYEGETLYPGDQAYDLVMERHNGDEAWLRRLQGNHGMLPTGLIDEATALLLGGREE